VDSLTWGSGGATCITRVEAVSDSACLWKTLDGVVGTPISAVVGGRAHHQPSPMLGT
jgi:hypothetical protein